MPDIDLRDATTGVMDSQLKGTDGAAHVHMATTLSGEDQANDVIKTERQYTYETVAVSQTAQVLGTTGDTGDLLHKVVVVNTVADATSAVTLLDGATSIPLVPASAPIGVYDIEINAIAVTAWKLTTLAGATAICVGRFT